jgi:hypothetical protein
MDAGGLLGPGRDKKKRMREQPNPTPSEATKDKPKPKAKAGEGEGEGADEGRRVKRAKGEAGDEANRLRRQPATKGWDFAEQTRQTVGRSLCGALSECSKGADGACVVFGWGCQERLPIKTLDGKVQLVTSSEDIAPPPLPQPVPANEDEREGRQPRSMRRGEGDDDEGEESEGSEGESDEGSEAGMAVEQAEEAMEEEEAMFSHMSRRERVEAKKLQMATLGEAILQVTHQGACFGVDGDARRKTVSESWCRWSFV